MPVEDPLYKAKNDLLGTALTKRNYRVMADLTEEATYKWLSWMRFLEYDGDMMVMAQAKMREENKKHDSSDSDEPTPHAWKAENLGVISLSNERRVLALIKKMSLEALHKYPNNMQVDMAMLEKDDYEHDMSFN